MADRLETPDPEVGRPVEVIHLPEPSYLPVTIAFGVMVALVGILTTFALSVIGAVIVVVCVFRWIGQARADMAELPLEH